MAGTLKSRSSMIRSLVEHSVNAAVLESPAHWLEEVFEKGFVGYNKLSASQLLMEMHLRGLIQSEDPFDDESRDADEDAVTDLIFN